MTVNNRMFILGGDTIYGYQYRQFEVLSDQVTQLDDLPFAFDQGICLAYSEQKGMVVRSCRYDHQY